MKRINFGNKFNKNKKTKQNSPTIENTKYYLPINIMLQVFSNNTSAQQFLSQTFDNHFSCKIEY